MDGVGQELLLRICLLELIMDSSMKGNRTAIRIHCTFFIVIGYQYKYKITIRMACELIDKSYFLK